VLAYRLFHENDLRILTKPFNISYVMLPFVIGRNGNILQDMTMIIKGRLSFGDYKKYQMHYAIPRYSIMFAVFAAGCFILKFGERLGNRFNFQPLASNIIVSILLALFMTSVLFASFYFRIRSLFNASEAMKLEQIYEMTDEGINMKSDQGEYLVKWADIRRAAYYRTYMILYTGRKLALLFPYSYFSSGSDLNKFKETLEKNKPVRL